MADEMGLDWHGCGDGQCLQVARQHDRVLVRDSGRPNAMLRFLDHEWTVFISAVSRGEFDRPASAGLTR